MSRTDNQRASPRDAEASEGAVIRSPFPGNASPRDPKPRAAVRGLYQVTRTCVECGESFWGTARSRFCCQRCRKRRWRAIQTRTPLELGELCAEILNRSQAGSDAYGKLLPRLFRVVGAELRRREWDPIELLLSIPDEPAPAPDADISDASGAPRPRRRWLRPPDSELAEIERLIEERESAGLSVEWHQHRRQQLQRFVERAPARREVK
jgi:hypothetical protein